MARPHVAVEGNGVQIHKLNVSVFNKQLRTAEKG